MTNVSCFFSEFLATAVLLILVFAMTDKKNIPPPNGLAPLLLFLLILGIGAALGMETGYAINPARDLGPRILTSMVGYGKAVYSFRKCVIILLPLIIFLEAKRLLTVNIGSGVLLWVPSSVLKPAHSFTMRSSSPAKKVSLIGRAYPHLELHASIRSSNFYLLQ